MTANDLIRKFNRYGLNKWPKTSAVDHVTYANVCQFIFESKIRNHEEIAFQGNATDIVISVGPNNGIMFKNVELILKTVVPDEKEEHE